LRWLVSSKSLPSVLPVARSARRRLPSRGFLGPPFPTFLGTMLRYDCPLSLLGRFASARSPIPCLLPRFVFRVAREGAEALLARQGSGSTGTPLLPVVRTRRPLALPSARVSPVTTCSALFRPRWGPAWLALTPAGPLPSTRARVSAFSPASTGIIRWTTTILIAGLHDAACRLTTPGSVPPLAEQHAGLLLSGWLGVAQVGLKSSDSHPLGNTDLFPGFILHSLDLGLRLARGASS
jgi:hypothetical protein